MSILRIGISKDPTTKVEREIGLQIIIVDNAQDEFEVRLLCTRYDLDEYGSWVHASAKLFTPTTVNEYVDDEGKKVDKKHSKAVKKKDFYTSKVTSGGKSDFLKWVDTLRAEVKALDKQGGFDAVKK